MGRQRECRKKQREIGVQAFGQAKDQWIDRLMEGWQNDSSMPIAERHLRKAGASERERERERKGEKGRRKPSVCRGVRERRSERGWQAAVMNDNCSSSRHAQYMEVSINRSHFFSFLPHQHNIRQCTHNVQVQINNLGDSYSLRGEFESSFQHNQNQFWNVLLFTQNKSLEKYNCNFPFPCQKDLRTE